MQGRIIANIKAHKWKTAYFYFRKTKIIQYIVLRGLRYILKREKKKKILFITHIYSYYTYSIILSPIFLHITFVRYFYALLAEK